MSDPTDTPSTDGAPEPEEVLMAADPTLADRQPVGPDLALAIQLEHRATQNAIVRSYGIMPSSRPEDDDLDRAAAVRLRKLDAIEPLIAKFRAEWDAAGWGNTPDDDAISASAYLGRTEQ